MAASSSPGVSPELLSTAKQWLEWDPNAETQQATQAMIEAASSEEGAAQLQAAFGSRIAFGTAGLRGRMATGTACMNDLIVVQAAQGLVAYLQEQLGEATANARGLVLGWDHRAAGSLNSKRFAALTAHVAASKGMSVVLFEQLVATPLVPFAILARKAAAGVMVTASHNPKADNGYKVYWGNGAQIIPPHDKGIAAAITSNLQPWTAPAELRDVTWDSVVALPQVTLAGDEDISAYIAAVTASQKRQLAPDATKLPVTYTAMHGVGYPFVQAAFESFGLPPPLPVPEQVLPDPTFPTVEFPNPEEGAGALALAMAAAEAGGSRLILANDPDADRLAGAEAGEDGNWRVFTGNEIAALLAWWTWSQRGEDCPPPDQCYMLASTVSSKMIGAMARANGFHFEETLTGFKWMGNRAAALQAEGKTVLFSFEEAIGFCLGDTVLDKDGVAAAAVFTQMAGTLAAQGKRVADQMTALYEEYGYFVTNNGYLFITDAGTVPGIFERLINGGKYQDALRQWKVASIRDLHGAGVDTSQPDGKPTLPTSASTHMLTYTFENGAVITLRTSGTEPKLKYYAEMAAGTPQAATAELQDMVDAVIEDMLQPEANKLRKPGQ